MSNDGSKMKTSALFAATLVIWLFHDSPSVAYPKLYGPFVPGTQPRKVTLHECALIQQETPIKNTYPSVRFFKPTGVKKPPLLKLLRLEQGWEITVLGKRGLPLLATPETNDMPSFNHRVYTADLNRDGIQDFIVNIWSDGCGLAAAGSTTTFLLSDGDKYKAESFYSFEFGPEDIVTLKSNGPCYFIHNELIGNGNEKTKDGRSHNFWVYQLYRIDRANFIKANIDHPQFPKWVWYTFKENHRETDQLTSEQKTRLLGR